MRTTPGPSSRSTWRPWHREAAWRCQPRPPTTRSGGRLTGWSASTRTPPPGAAGPGRRRKSSASSPGLSSSRPMREHSPGSPSWACGAATTPLPLTTTRPGGSTPALPPSWECKVLAMTVKPSFSELAIYTADVEWRGSGEGPGAIQVAFVTALGEDWVLLRVHGDADGLVSVFTRFEWECFLDGAKNGEFDDAAR